jgi:hypothetical protein
MTAVTNPIAGVANESTLQICSLPCRSLFDRLRWHQGRRISQSFHNRLTALLGRQIGDRIFVRIRLFHLTKAAVEDLLGGHKRNARVRVFDKFDDPPEGAWTVLSSEAADFGMNRGNAKRVAGRTWPERN